MIAGHPHTVRSSHVPMYMRGWPPLLGQDEGDSGIVDYSGAYAPPITPNVMMPPIAPVGPDISEVFTAPTPGLTPGAGPVLSPANQAYANLLAQQQVDPNPLDYASPQAAIAAGVPAAQVNAAWSSINAGAAASGAITAAQAAQLTTAAASVAKAAQGLTTAPSPRVTLPAVAASPSILTSLTQSTLVPGVPNIALLALGAAAILAMGKR